MPLPVRPMRAVLACLGLVISLAACQASSSSPILLPIPTIQQSSTPVPTATEMPAPASSPTAAATPEPSAKANPQLCSPLQGIAWADMPATIFNPFHPPKPGSDDPHQGVDFADTGAGGIALQGRVVQAVMDGQVAAVSYYGESQSGIMEYIQGVSRLVGDDPFLIEDILNRLPPGSQAARTAFDIALHDLWGKLLGQPLYRRWD